MFLRVTGGVPHSAQTGSGSPKGGSYPEPSEQRSTAARKRSRQAASPSLSIVGSPRPRKAPRRSDDSNTEVAQRDSSCPAAASLTAQPVSTPDDADSHAPAVSTPLAASPATNPQAVSSPSAGGSLDFESSAAAHTAPPPSVAATTTSNDEASLRGSYLFVDWPTRLGAVAPQTPSAARPADATGGLALSAGLPAIGAYVEVCAGEGALSRAMAFHGLQPAAFFETDSMLQSCLQREFGVPVFGDVLADTASLNGVEAVAVGGGTPCTPVAPNGDQSGLQHRSARVTVSAVPTVAKMVNALFTDVENHEDLAIVNNGEVLKALDAAHAACGFKRTPRCAGAPHGVERCNPARHNGPVHRRRLALHYEKLCVILLLGECPQLRMLTYTLAIKDIMLPLDQVQAQAVPGRIVMRPPTHKPDLTKPLVVADLWYGAESDPIIAGSRVNIIRTVAVQLRRRDGSSMVTLEATLDIYVVVEIASTESTLFVDDRHGAKYYFHVPLNALTHVLHKQFVLSTDSVAGSFTRFGVPTVYGAKQLWLRDGRAYRPSPLELRRLLEHADSTSEPYLLSNPAASHRDLEGVAGNGMSSRMTEAIAARTSVRARRYATAVAISSATDKSCSEYVLAQSFDDVTAAGKVTLLVCVNQHKQALVAADLCSLPAVGRRFPDHPGPDESRGGAVLRAERLAAAAFPALRPVGFLVHDAEDFRVVCCPVAAVGVSTPYALWAGLDELASTPTYLPVGAAIAHTATYLSQREPGADGSLIPTRGRRSIRRVGFQRPLELELAPAPWLLQLQYAEATDALVRVALTKRSSELRSSDPSASRWLLDMVAQTDTSRNSTLPDTLRGRKARFSTAARTPYTWLNRFHKTKAPSPPVPQATTFRPRCITNILMPHSIRRLAKGLRAVVYDMINMRDNPDTFRRTATTVIISQGGFWPNARAIIWDIANPKFDELGMYYAPVEFVGDTNTHLDRQGILYEELGDDYPDQELRACLRPSQGFHIVHAADLQIVLCPHLVDLSNGFNRVGKELRRLERLGYVTFNKPAARLDDDIKLIASLSVLPCRLAAQGTVERAKEPGRPRRKVDGGSPHGDDKVDDDGVPVRSLNAIIRAGPSPPPEVKPLLRHDMINNAVLQSAAAIVHEPVVGLTDDMKDMFNHLFVSLRQRWLSTIAWLDGDTFVHVVENSLGYGVSINSNYAQRFADAVMLVFHQRFDVIEASHPEPLLSAWLGDRRRLPTHKPEIGRREDRLYAALVYTDDFSLECVGVARLLRMALCWYKLTTDINAHMAIADKRHIGTCAMRLGLHQLRTLGAIVIPDEKRDRATRQLGDVVRLTRPSLADYSSMVGLLEHLIPFTGMDRSYMHGLHQPKSWLHDYDSTVKVPISDTIAAQCQRWIDLLCSCTGVSVLVVLHRRRPPPAQHASAFFEIASDAAKDGTSKPGLGGHCYGKVWCLPLTKADVVGPLSLPIPVLEFAALAVNFDTFAPTLPAEAPILMVTDSLTSSDALAEESARSELMQFVYLWLVGLDTFQERSDNLYVQHGFGDGNAIADAKSRGYDDVLRRLCLNLGVRHEEVTPSQRAQQLMMDLRAANVSRVRRLSALERGTSPEHSSNDAGDGPREERPNRPPSISIPSPVASADGRSSSRAERTLSAQSPGASARSPHSSRPPVHSGPSRMSRVLSPSDAHIARPQSIRPDALRRPAESEPSRPYRSRWQSMGARIGASPADAFARSPISAPVLSTSARAYTSELLADLRSDDSALALRPTDPDFLDSMAHHVAAAVDNSHATQTHSKDDGRWAKWEEFTLRLMGTPQWRTDAAANDGRDQRGFRREVFLLTAFMLWVYLTMRPRRRTDPSAKPVSASKYIETVRRVHARRMLTLPKSPSISQAVRGLTAAYVRLHGPESLIPHRKEPLTNDKALAMLRRAASGFQVAGRTLCERSLLYKGFRAFLTTARHTGSRKADLLPVTAPEFDGRHMARSNLWWRIGGVVYKDPSPDLLSTLSDGDLAILKPAATKADPFALTFGDRPMWLPFVPGDILNAAAALADIEICMPCRGDDRPRTPLFTICDRYISLDHALADTIFNTLALAEFGPEVAATLSNHSARVWLACALLAMRKSDGTIQAFCRWKSAESVRIYARIQPEDYADTIRGAMAAEVDSSLCRSLPIHDSDGAVAKLRAEFDQREQAMRRSASPAAPAANTTTAEPAQDGAASDESDNERDCEPPPPPVTVGAVLDAADIVVGAAVAVPMRVDGVETHCTGRVVALRPNQARVTFDDDGDSWDVNHNRLYSFSRDS